MFDKSNSILIPGSMFVCKGGWISDPQFMEVMGSSCMLAHGKGVPVADASSSFNVPSDGNYHLYVRTRNWTARWSDAPTPGVFEIHLDGKPAPVIFGNGSSEWEWQAGGDVFLTKGLHEVAAHDLTGFDGRFDSVLLTMSQDVPGDIASLRRRLLDNPDFLADKGHFDFVVVGGGVAGMCAAISAARLGLKAAIIQDRKIFGGNNSSEVRVGLGGRLNIGKYPSLGYLLNEFAPKNKGNARPFDVYEDDAKMNAILAENNIVPFIGYKVLSAKTQNGRIVSVVATNVDDYSGIEISGDLFADCTGDATLGVLAGARWHMGRESRDTFNEPSAPEHADGTTLGASVQWYSEEGNGPVPFPDIDWGLNIDESTVQKVRRGQWYWEVGMADDQIADAEIIRDYGMYVVYSNWSYIKNHSSFKDEYANSELAWLSYYAGKRESRRIMGAYVLTENDLKNFVLHPDGCVSTSWYIDDHKPDPDNAAAFKDPWLSCGCLTPLDHYPIPFRCLYSNDVPNMFMAGRNISVSHLALGTVRVMRTCAMEGEVLGMAARVCKDHGCLPDDVYSTYFSELERLMEKGTGDSSLPYYQTYTLIDTTAVRSEDC